MSALPLLADSEVICLHPVLLVSACQEVKLDICCCEYILSAHLVREAGAMSLLSSCRRVVVPAPGAPAGGLCAERCLGGLHLRCLLLCLAQPAAGSGGTTLIFVWPALMIS